MSQNRRVRSQATRPDSDPSTENSLPQIAIELHQPIAEHEQKVQASPADGQVFVETASELGPDESENDPLAAQGDQSSGKRHRGRHVIGGFALVMTFFAGSWYGLPIREVEVFGNNNIDASEVKKLAGLAPNFGWLYYGAWQVKGVFQNPWVKSIKLTRVFPNKIQLHVREHVPFVRFQPSQGKTVVLSKSGHKLPLTSDSTRLPLVKGWGPDRINDALLIVRALSRYNIKAVEFTPSGVTVHTADAAVWSGDLKSLMKYAGSIGMYPNKQIHIYPWGVSVQQ